MENKKTYWYLTPYFLILVLSIICGICFSIIKKKDTEINIQEQNIKSLNDSIRISKNKLGESEFSKNILIGDINTLKKYNSDLYNLFKKTDGKVSELTQYLAIIDNKITNGVKTDVVEYDNLRYGLKWENDTIYNNDNSRLLAGESIFDVKFNEGKTEIIPFKTIITRDLTTIKVSQGLRKKGDNIEVFVTSNHPNFKVQELNSMIINPNDHVIKDFIPKDNKRFGLGVSVGYGLNKEGFTPTINFGLNYNVVRF